MYRWLPIFSFHNCLTLFSKNGPNISGDNLNVQNRKWQYTLAFFCFSETYARDVRRILCGQKPAARSEPRAMIVKTPGKAQVISFFERRKSCLTRVV